VPRNTHELTGDALIRCPEILLRSFLLFFLDILRGRWTDGRAHPRKRIWWRSFVISAARLCENTYLIRTYDSNLAGREIQRGGGTRFFLLFFYNPALGVNAFVQAWKKFSKQHVYMPLRGARCAFAQIYPMELKRYYVY